MGRFVMKPVVMTPGGGEKISFGKAVATWFKAEGQDTAGSLSITENVLECGFAGPKLHSHRVTFDMFYVLDGKVSFRIGDERVDASAGSFVLVPPGVLHTFSNPNDEPARLLNIQTPAGLEQYLKEVAAEVSDGPLDQARMAEIAAKYDFVPAE